MGRGTSLSPVKVGIIMVGVFALTAVFVTAFLMERLVSKEVLLPGSERFFNQLPVQGQTTKTYSTSSTLQAVLKGSIYETGSNMTVFGACLDGDGYLLPVATANFTAWYPNGTVLVQNQVMLPILNGSGNVTGQWRVHVTMGSTIGTYFTQIRCDYNSDYAIAFSEWQNPEWVKKIGDTLIAVLGINATQAVLQSQLTNLSTQVSGFQSEVSSNFSTVISLMNGLNGSSSNTSEKLKEIYELGRSLQEPFWVLDARDYLYAPSSGLNDLRAVDVVPQEGRVYVAGLNGVYGVMNGTSWNFSNVANASWFGVSALERVQSYFILVGKNGSFSPVEISFTSGSGKPFYSINGAAPQTINVSWFTGMNASAFVDVKIFVRPNDPYGAFFGYLLTDRGNVIYTDDGAATWRSVLNLSTGGFGRFSNVLANGDGGVTDGYRLAVATGGGSFAYFNGTSWSEMVGVNVSYADVVLVHENVGYIVGEDVLLNRTVVWTFNGVLVAQQGFIGASNIGARSIDAVARDDAWVATVNPGVFYHYDGFAWTPGGSLFEGNGTMVVLSFVNVSSVRRGLHDMALLDASHGYAVGDDGQIVRLLSVTDRQFDTLIGLLGSLNVSLSGNVSIDLSQVLAALGNLTNITLALNQTMVQEFAGIQTRLDGLNVSILFLQNTSNMILSNVTYTQQYLETTINPALNSILVGLGIIGTTVNETLVIVNRTEQKVDILLNRSDRPRAWTTQ